MPSGAAGEMRYLSSIISHEPIMLRNARYPARRRTRRPPALLLLVRLIVLADAT
jgi:hypothetical protein